MNPFPSRRPPGLRVAPASPSWWRIDHDHPGSWSWDPTGFARHRFDSPTGRFRLRYAANDPVAAARERFAGRWLSEVDGRLWLVHLERPPSAFHLTHQRNLDALGFDDRINTGRLDAGGRGDPLLAISQSLADHVWDWWGGAPPPIAYRTRSMPTARSLAFGESCRWHTVQARPLREARALLVSLVLHHGFDVPDAWLAG